jgi:hypothetical protein
MAHRWIAFVQNWVTLILETYPVRKHKQSESLIQRPMILEFRLPLISPNMVEAVIECLWAALGSNLRPGDKLLDLSVHLGANFAQDCPPIGFFRVIVREKAVLREFRVVPGQHCVLDEVVAVFSTTADDSLEQTARRGIRFATAGIIHHSGMWTGNVR